MKDIVFAVLFLFLANAESRATWTGKLDLSPTVNGVLAREVHDGQWLAGFGKTLWTLNYSGNPLYPAGPVLNLGGSVLYNAENGNASYCPMLGYSFPAAFYAGSLLKNMNMPKVGSFVDQSGGVLSLDGFGGWRPQHTPDVIGPWVYGWALTLKVPFGAVSQAQRATLDGD